MKIAIIGVRGIPANYGGFETCAEQTAIRFAQKHDVYVYCRKTKSTQGRDTYHDVHLIKIVAIKGKGIETLSHTLFSILHLLFHNKIQIVHLYNAANAIFIPLLKLAGKKVVISVDGLEWKRLKWGRFARIFYKISEYICARAADTIICDSKVIQRYYKRKFNTQTEYIPYGADTLSNADPSILAKFDLRERAYLLFVGRLVPEKGVHNLISAFNKLNPNVPLVIIGDDFQQGEYIATLKCNANSNVRFLGFVYGQNYQAINRYPYAYVTASLLEGTSPALVAAMGAGNCVLVNGIEENLETIGRAGIFFNENNIDDLVAKMKWLIDNPKEVAQYRQKAARHVEETYDWDIIAKTYLRIFSALLKLSPIYEEKISLPTKSENQPVDTPV